MPDFVLPVFKPEVPEFLKEGRTKFEIYQMEEASINRQCVEFMMRQQHAMLKRLEEGDSQFAEIKEEARRLAAATDEKFKAMTETVETLEKWRLVLTSKAAVFGMILSAIALPLGIAWFSAYMSSHFPPVPK